MRKITRTRQRLSGQLISPCVVGYLDFLVHIGFLNKKKRLEKVLGIIQNNDLRAHTNAKVAALRGCATQPIASVELLFQNFFEKTIASQLKKKQVRTHV